MEFAVIGSEDFVLGFRLAGIKRVYTIEGSIESQLLPLLEDQSIGVLAVNSSDLLNISGSARRKALENIVPVVVPVGAEEGDLREKVKRAIGVDLYKTE